MGGCDVDGHITEVSSLIVRDTIHQGERLISDVIGERWPCQVMVGIVPVQ